MIIIWSSDKKQQQHQAELLCEDEEELLENTAQSLVDISCSICVATICLAFRTRTPSTMT